MLLHNDITVVCNTSESKAQSNRSLWQQCSQQSQVHMTMAPPVGYPLYCNNVSVCCVHKENLHVVQENLLKIILSQIFLLKLLLLQVRTGSKKPNRIYAETEL